MKLFSRMLTFNRVRDGEDGSAGPMPVPEGSWDKNKTYLRDQYKTPIVEHLGLMYTLNKEGEFQGINPKDDYAENGKNGTWVLVPDYELLIVQALVANFGKIGGAIFYKALMMSQYGVDKNGNSSSSYDQYPINFTPNLMLDFEKGSISANNAFIKGIVANNYVDWVDAKVLSDRVIDVTANCNLFGIPVSNTFLDTLYLPDALPYSGFTVNVFNSGLIGRTNSFTIRTRGSSRLVLDDKKTSTYLYVNPGELVEFTAIPTINDTSDSPILGWVVHRKTSTNID